ncbi:hypothetical protein K1719_042915 [Acacia pycnantha]|nr:hypothetical protein K1719_042915 [Acacia pycnantha]
MSALLRTRSPRPNATGLTFLLCFAAIGCLAAMSRQWAVVRLHLPAPSRLPTPLNSTVLLPPGLRAFSKMVTNFGRDHGFASICHAERRLLGRRLDSCANSHKTL